MNNLFFTQYFEMLDEALATYIQVSSANIIIFLQPIFTSLCIIYIAMWGISHVRGTAGEPIMNGIIRLIKIAVITQLGLTVGLYNEYIAQFFYTAPAELIAAVNGVTPDGTYFDAIAMKGFNLGTVAWNKAGVYYGDFGMYIVAFLIWFAVGVTLAIAAFYLILSKFMVSVLLAVGPLFIILTLFDATKRFCDSWVGQVVNYALVGVIATLFVGLFFESTDVYLTKLLEEEEASTQAAMSLALLAVINIGLMLNITSVAAALGGGLAMNVHGALATLKKAASPAKQINTKNAQKAYQGIKSAAGAPSRAYAKMRGNKISKK